MAVRNLRNVAKDANKTPKSSKAKSYAKVRDDLKSSLTKVNDVLNSGNLSSDAIEKANNLRSSLQDAIDKSYQVKSGNGKGKYPYSLDKLERSSDYASQLLNEGIGISSRKNEMFVRDINQASTGGVSTKSKEEVKIFYTMTRDAWEGSDIEKRHDKILQYYDAESLQEVWDKVMEDELAKKALSQAKEAQKKIETEADITNGEGDEKDNQGSPTYIKELVLALDTNYK